MLSFAALPFFGDGLSAEENPADALLYQQQIKPLLEKRCFACHGALKQESSLRVDSGEYLLKGGELGPAVVPGDLNESLLFQTITGEAGFLMPPEGDPLTSEEIALIKNWIEAGAPLPEDDQPEADPQDHWAFQPIIQPELPEIQNQDWATSPIDYFIAAHQEAEGIKPASPAEKEILLRRVYLDLIGLPPTREQLHTFLKDDRPEAYAEVVEELLNNPHYGERWGRHWMDVWRYSDWYGRRGVNDMTNSYSTIWRWRDWIIDSLNEDKGYDQMVREMLAADELYPEDREKHVATGFIVRNYYRWNYHTWLKDSVEHTGKAFLGLTFNCCECHDHKYDPIGQQEYFSMRAFFEPLDLRHNRVPGEVDPGPFPDYKLSVLNPPIRTGQVQVYDRYPEKETKAYTGGVETNIVADKPAVEAAPPRFLGGDKVEIAVIELPAQAWYPGLQQFVIQEETARREAEVARAADALQARESELLPRIKELNTELQLFKERQAKPGEVDTSLASTSNQQAIQLAAETGRRVLQHGISKDVEFNNQTLLQFQVKLIKDGLANFQLSHDLAAGQTNLYLAFTKGEIQAYVPGSGYVPQVIGSYGSMSEPRQFQAELQFDPENDVAYLTLTDIATTEELLTRSPLSLHGWKAMNSNNCGIFLDVQPDTIAEFDDICFRQQDQTEPWLSVDFEYPMYQPGNDAVGTQNWQLSRFSMGDGHSQVVYLGEMSADQLEARTRLAVVQEQLQTAESELRVLQSQHEAALTELNTYLKVVSSEQARYRDKTVPDEELPAFSAALAHLQRESKLKQAQSKHIAASFALRQAQALPAEQADRAKQIQTAEESLATTQTELTAAEKSLAETSTEYEALSRQLPKISTGKRAALANWITDPVNPLPARVAVNHLWAKHFGQPLVKTTYNFGRSGAAPSHPELLNWLAAELQQHDWSLKHLHRLIVTSQTYQQSSRSADAPPSNLEIDQDNRTLWHYPGHRLEAEVIRDSLLLASGEFDSAFYGQEIELEAGLESNRRTIYLSHHGEGKLQFLEMFDVADPCDCYLRKTTVLPQQALALANSELSLTKGRLLARALWNEISPGTSEEDLQQTFIVQAFEQILSRAPSEAEQEASLRFLHQQQELFASEPITSTEQAETPPAPGSLPATEPQARALENLVHALLNHSDFITVR
ncbi:MAG: DUF1549 domain-containing protein [Planctomycetaceae bacterium]